MPGGERNGGARATGGAAAAPRPSLPTLLLKRHFTAENLPLARAQVEDTAAAAGLGGVRLGEPTPVTATSWPPNARNALAYEARRASDAADARSRRQPDHNAGQTTSAACSALKVARSSNVAIGSISICK